MKRLAVLGASGFIGTRAVELFHLESLYDIRPVVRNFGGLARVARFDLDSRIADATNVEELTKAFDGCDFVIHAALGDAKLIVDSAVAVYKAAQASGVKRIVYFSSAAVHGLAPEEGTSENSALSRRQRFVYNNAKVIAERKLLELRKQGQVELVILRPGIVYGPRSGQWISGIADELLAGRAYLVNDGKGVLNAVYVDNLLEAVRLALDAPATNCDSQAFLISDKELTKWCELYGTLARALRIKIDDIYQLNEEEVKQALAPSRQDVFHHIRAYPLVQKFLPFLPSDLKAAIKKIIFGAHGAAGKQVSESPQLRKPLPTAELVTLQSCRYKVPNSKAEELLCYKPIVSFAEGMRRSIGWLSFARYPVEYN